MRYGIDVIQKAEIELLAQMLRETSTTKMKLSLESGISRQHLGLVANGKRNFSLKSFCDLADAFGCSATELMSKLETLMQKELALREQTLAAEKAKGLSYVQRAALDIDKKGFIRIERK
ncbi:MAG: helix-turn-helix transcriptional regulator [Fibrobacter sp.]|jgi:transcriptional regulator with XRE-family HTH domain|nr:helix-turn-helix transcriptional regulator [Fibrobacter sp.]